MVFTKWSTDSFRHRPACISTNPAVPAVWNFADLYMLSYKHAHIYIYIYPTKACLLWFVVPTFLSFRVTVKKTLASMLYLLFVGAILPGS